MTFLAKVSEILPGERKLITVQGTDVAVFHVADRFYAVNNSCPHRQGPLIRGTLLGADEERGCSVRCPMHGWRFDLETGDSHGRPGNARVYALVQRHDELYIDLESSS
jgi:nitrite reductase/ring-hydroxylating ferredoxin subunit